MSFDASSITHGKMDCNRNFQIPPKHPPWTHNPQKYSSPLVKSSRFDRYFGHRMSSAFSHTNPPQRGFQQESGFALAPQVRARRVRHPEGAGKEVSHESYRNHQVYSEKGSKVYIEGRLQSHNPIVIIRSILRTAKKPHSKPIKKVTILS